MARDLNAALRSRREMIIREGHRTFAVLSPDGSRESVRDWYTAVYLCARMFAEHGGTWEAQEFAWDPDANDAYLVARRRVFA